MHARSDSPIELYEVWSNTEMVKEWRAKLSQMEAVAR